MRTYIPLSQVVPDGLWPDDLLGPLDESALAKLACLRFDSRGSETEFGIFVRAQVMAEVRVPLPFLEGVALVLGAGDEPDAGLVDVEISGEVREGAEPALELRVHTSVLGLEIDSGLLRPVDLVWTEDGLVTIPREGGVRLALPFGVSLRRENGAWSFAPEVAGADEAALTLPPCLVGDTGVVVEAAGVSLSLSGSGPRPAGSAPGWRGVYLADAGVYLPQLFAGRIGAQGLGIGTGGVGGTLSATFPGTRLDDPQAPTRYEGPGAASLGGFHFGMESVEIELHRNVPVRSAIRGGVLFPFFDQAVRCELSISAGGGMSASFAAEGGDGALFAFEKEDLLRVAVREAGISIPASGPAVAEISGEGQLLVPGFGAPALPVESLRISSEGDVSVGGGGIRFPRGARASVFGLPVEVTSFTFGADAEAGTRFVGFSAQAGGGTSPLSVSVQGLRVVWTRETARDPLRHPPRVQLDGAGVSIQAGPVRGGGMLVADREQERYAGAITLAFQAIALNAVAVVDLRMPDGSRGVSLLVLVAGEFTPIQLGYGFTLNGVGGLLGAHRSVAVEELRAGIRERSLDNVLFPRDPVAQMPTLLPALSRTFPVAYGRYAVGPMARIGWGTPTLLTLDLGIVVELPEPVRIVALGRFRMALPDERSALVRINMDAMGVVELERSTAAIDATLYDSQVAGLPISGDMALRASWGAKPAFALSAGGFHPAFRPPPGFPALRRLAIALTNGDNPRVRLEAYLALTSNTVQVGARVEARASALGFVVEGWLSFDALVQLDPFGFQVNIGAAAALKRGRTTLMSVRLKLDLSGPAPWRARGEAHFSLLFISGTVRVDVKSGRAKPLPPRSAVNVGMEVVNALSDPRNWTAQPPAAGSGMVTLRKVEAAAGELLVHPLGSLGFRQTVAPLGVRLERYGNADVTGVDRVVIQQVTYGDPRTPLKSTRVLRESFAPAQFLTLSDQQKLASPSFQEFEAGRELGLGGTDYDREPRLPVPTGHMIIFNDSLKGLAARGAGEPVTLALPPAEATAPANRYALPPLGVEVRETRYMLVDTSAAPDARAPEAGLRSAKTARAEKAEGTEEGMDYATALDLLRASKRAGTSRMRVVPVAGGAR